MSPPGFVEMKDPAKLILLDALIASFEVTGINAEASTPGELLSFKVQLSIEAENRAKIGRRLTSINTEKFFTIRSSIKIILCIKSRVICVVMNCVKVCGGVGL